jgi:hypothetical protein
LANEAAPDQPRSSSRPVPDPTTLTTSALHREVKALRELIESELQATSQVTFEKFRSIETQMALVEAQRVEQKADTKAAIDAALTAQKEAVREQTIANNLAFSKSEGATAKQLEQLKTTFDTAIAGVSISLADVKERVGRIESVKVGGRETVNAVYAFTAFLVALLVIGGSLAAAGIFKK